MERLDRTKARVTRLGEEEEQSLLESTTAAERIGMVWEVSITAFEFAGEENARGVWEALQESVRFWAI